MVSKTTDKETEELVPSFNVRPADTGVVKEAEKKLMSNLMLGSFPHPLEEIVSEYAKYRVKLPDNYETSLRVCLSRTDESKGKLTIVPTRIIIFENIIDGQPYFTFEANVRGTDKDGNPTNIGWTTYGISKFPRFKEAVVVDLDGNERTIYEWFGNDDKYYLPFQHELIKELLDTWAINSRTTFIQNKRKPITIIVKHPTNGNRAPVIEQEDATTLTYNELVSKYCNQMYKPK